VVNSPQFAFMSKAIQEGKIGKVSAAHDIMASWPTGQLFYEKEGQPA